MPKSESLLPAAPTPPENCLFPNKTVIFPSGNAFLPCCRQATRQRPTLPTGNDLPDGKLGSLQPGRARLYSQPLIQWS